MGSQGPHPSTVSDPSFTHECHLCTWSSPQSEPTTWEVREGFTTRREGPIGTLSPVRGESQFGVESVHRTHCPRTTTE